MPPGTSTWLTAPTAVFARLISKGSSRRSPAAVRALWATAARRLPLTYPCLLWISRLPLCALALGACAAPAAIPPTTAPTAPPTATALPATATPTAQNTTAPLNIPVPATSVLLDNPQDIAFDTQGN